MAEPVASEKSVAISSELNLDYLKAGEHTLVIPLPDDVVKHIGQIVVLWGGFEFRMDVMIETILPRLHMQEPGGWRQLNFKKRKRLVDNDILQGPQSGSFRFLAT